MSTRPPCGIPCRCTGVCVAAHPSAAAPHSHAAASCHEIPSLPFVFASRLVKPMRCCSFYVALETLLSVSCLINSLAASLRQDVCIHTFLPLTITKVTHLPARNRYIGLSQIGQIILFLLSFGIVIRVLVYLKSSSLTNASNLVYCFWKYSSTLPVLPCRCLAIIRSAIPLRLLFSLR